MTHTLHASLAGPPWDAPLAGTLTRHLVRSQALADNPLGDPPVRPLYVYTPPGAPEGLPTVYVIQGYTGQVEAWMSRNPFESTFLERLDAMFASGACPPALVVLVDAWTRLGGSQFLNSTATGRYLDYRQVLRGLRGDGRPDAASRRVGRLCLDRR